MVVRCDTRGGPNLKRAGAIPDALSVETHPVFVDPILRRLAVVALSCNLVIGIRSAQSADPERHRPNGDLDCFRTQAASATEATESDVSYDATAFRKPLTQRGGVWVSGGVLPFAGALVD